MKSIRLFIFISFTFSCTFNLNAEYQIKGIVNLSSEWQRQIFLSTIDKIDDYNILDPTDIIQVGVINEDGSFIIEGVNLPPSSRFYRLYLIKEENSEFDACVYVGGDDHNFMHLILDNNTNIQIQSDSSQQSPFANYRITGSKANNNLRSLSELILPSYYFHKIKFPSELQFSKQKLNRDLFHFADTCKTTLVSLAALINTDMDQYFDEEFERYSAFADRLSSKLPNHEYTDNYFRKLKYYQGTDFSNSILPFWAYLLIGILSLSILILLFRLRNLSHLVNNQHLLNTNKNLWSSLTQQEEKILRLIGEGKSNKEIASQLFIEVSTVKSHINKLYAKLSIKNRNDARQKSNQLAFKGV